ncbi:MAG TPA: outer membrane beta-barrel protein [Bryobacteraceae bacterium]|nr:outer membrane beta-barrel protein [Bryobacteraceae bacterium]
MKYLIIVLLPTCVAAQKPLTGRERMLLERIEELERRLALLEERTGRTANAEPAAAPASRTPPGAANPEATPASKLPEGATISVNLDGYYGYNFNRPYGGTNVLRAYDVSSNSFSLNQAGIIFERTADLAGGRRFAARLDLQFGQATETLQGSAANERRPEVYRHVFQAYGSYTAPVGKGLTIDFGKFASSFGIENNYTKDQLNYSRSYWFSFLPFYHMGIRTSYALTGKVNASYWLTNGLNQTEDFNKFKSHAIVLNFKPTSNVSANLNYFSGQEQRAVSGREPRGRSHVIDSYMPWQATDRLLLAAEADCVISRVEAFSPPRRVTGGAGYARYRFRRKFNLASRFEYLNDLGGLFGGVTQSLKDATLTANFDVESGFQVRLEYRRDWPDVPYFPTANPNRLNREQNTALLGLIWWFGGKQGAW